MPPVRPLLVSAYVGGMRVLGALGLAGAAAVALAGGRFALLAPLVAAISFATLLSAQGLGGRWRVAGAMCVGASLGELALAGMIVLTNATLWQWAGPLLVVAILTSGVLVAPEARAWLAPRVARFEVVSSA